MIIELLKEIGAVFLVLFVLSFFWDAYCAIAGVIDYTIEKIVARRRKNKKRVKL